MRKSMLEILNLVIDGEVTTKEQAAALVQEEAEASAGYYKITVEESRKKVLQNIGYVTGYLSHKQADKVMDLFQTEHPIFGKTHPTAEEAFELELKYAERSKKKENG